MPLKLGETNIRLLAAIGQVLVPGKKYSETREILESEFWMTNHPCVSERSYKIQTPRSPLFPNTSCLGRVVEIANVALGMGTGIVVHVNTPQTKGGRIGKLNSRSSESSERVNYQPWIKALPS